MTITLEPHPATQDAAAAVRDLTPEIIRRAPEIEAARQVPADLLDRLRAAGCLRLLRPATHGGAGAAFPAAMPVFEELSRADASVGWIALIGSATWLDLVELSRPVFDSIYAPGADPFVAGVFSPSGVAVPVEGGYQVNGRWSFASGCEHADWLYGNCVDASSGEPQLRIAVFHPDEVEIEDTWRVSGLCGTGSHHFAVHDVVVPADRTVNLFGDSPCVDIPAVRIPVPTAIAVVMATVPLGIARGALDDVIELARDKMPLLASEPLAASPMFQQRLADADVKLRAARALLYAEATDLWAAAEAGAEITAEQRARVRSAAVLATATAADVVETAYRAAGGSALYLECPLQRRLRDVEAVSQHFLLKPDTLVTCGAIVAGLEPDLTIF